MGIRKFLVGSAAVLALVCGAEVAQAGTLNATASAAQAGAGGEFKVNTFSNGIVPIFYGVNWVGAEVGGASDAGLFRTFCIETTESFNFGTDYLYTLDTQVINQGGAGTDTLSDASAKLFYTFWTNQWDASDENGMSHGLTYAYFGTNAERQADAAALQDALWYLENESGFTYAGLSAKAQAMVDFATDSLTTWSLLGTGWTDTNGTGANDGRGGDHSGGVMVINPFLADGTLAQSLLVVVPLPAGALMGFALLGALGIAKRIRSRRQSDLV